MRIAEYIAHQTIRNARRLNQRTGQALFNSLPDGASNAVIGCIWDPFNRELSLHELEQWIDDHLILADDMRCIGVFGNNEILWEDDDVT